MQRPINLLRQIEPLIATVSREREQMLRGWTRGAGSRDLPAGLSNLADYLALRHCDLSSLQEPLATLGLSSLGRSEAHVMASLRALVASLSRIAKARPLPYPSARYRRGASAALKSAQASLFGTHPRGPGTRIMATLPTEAATDPALVRALLEAGMSCARINCAHDDAATWIAMAHNVRAAAAAANVDCRILMDIAGAKCRIETVHSASEKLRLFRGDRLVLVREMACATAADRIIATLNFPDLVDAPAAGAEVWINDGRIGTRVIARAPGRTDLEVISAPAKGARLRPEKGVNFPGTELRLDPLTPGDFESLDTISEHADLVGFSFVQRPEHVRQLHAALAERRAGRPPLPLLLKIETALAVRNLPRLIAQAMLCGPVGVMIARGDLAVEIGFARLSEIQEEIMWLCEAAHTPVVWATEVLDALVKDGMPTRAEATDAAMSQRAECVMLNKGPFLPDAVAFLADVLRRMDRHQSKKSHRFGPLRSWPVHELEL